VPVAINSAGLREREIGPKPPGQYRILVLGDDTRSLCLLPPRYRGHETELAKIYGLAGTREVGLRAEVRREQERLAGQGVETESRLAQTGLAAQEDALTTDAHFSSTP